MIVTAFGKRIQAYLHASGYTQKQLAPALGISVKVLSRKLTGSSNAQFNHREIHALLLKLIDWQILTNDEDILNLLAEAEIEPATIFRADEWQQPPLSTLIHRKPVILPTDPPQALHNLPAPVGPLIGRSWAVSRLPQLLGRDGTRLVTLIGPGGSGKTRLALHVARELVEAFPQGVWLVSFTEISDPGMVPHTIAQALNLKSRPSEQPLQTITTFLGRRRALLVLDNFEHVAEASDIIDTLLASAPDLKVLITSRIVFHLPGEYEFSVPPLDFPDPALALSMSATEILSYSAIQLFVERAQAVLPDFTLSRENAATIAQICASVAGLPLALELAAARVKVLPPEILQARLSQARLPLLSRVGRQTGRHVSLRHQTLSETIRWSYDLLLPEEQTWFRRLGVFLGGWALESSEAMVSEIARAEKKPATFETVDLITQLVNNSLLVRVDGIQKHARFTMLSTLREYALERLDAQDETAWLRDWHAYYCLRRAEAGELALRGPRQLTALASLTDGRSNVRGAFEWALQKARAGQSSQTSLPAHTLSEEVANCRTLSHRPLPTDGISALEVSLRLATAMRAYWEWQGALTEARSWLNAALELPQPNNPGTTLLAARARALSEAGRLMVLQNEQDDALKLVDESIELWRDLNDPSGLANALLHRGWALHARNQYLAARETYQEGLALLTPDRDTWLYAEILLCMAGVAGFQSDLERARRYYARCRELFEKVGDTSAIADAWKDQGGVSILASEHDEAIQCLLTSIRICRELDHKQYLATALGSLSFALGLREKPDTETASLFSAQIQGASESLMAMIGLTPWTTSTPFIHAVRLHIRSHVDEERWNAALNAGRALNLEQALDLAFRLAQYPQEKDK